MKINGKDINSRIDRDDKPKSPFTFVENQSQKQKPFSFIDNNIEGEKKFVINRLTDNGAYVKGGMLYFRLNGVDIFTEITNSIFVDKSNNSVIIRPANNLQNIEDENVDPEQRQYILLMYGGETDETYYWESMTGRTDTYQYIKDNIEFIDPEKSIVLTENVAVKDAFTVYQFVKYLQNGGLIEDEEEFDIDSYI